MTLFDIYNTLDPESVDKWLGYLPVYDHWFSPLRGRELRVLEIGVDRGGSLKLWKEYLGERAQIVGVDIRPECAAYAEDRISIEIGDQGDVKFISRVGAKHGPFDIVIDDGSHHASHQLNAWNILYPITRKFYCVEDTHTSYWPDFQQGAFPPDFITFAKINIDMLHDCFLRAGTPDIFSDEEWKEKLGGEQNPFRARLKGIHFYDSLVVMEAGSNPLPQRRKRLTTPATSSSLPSSPTTPGAA